MSYKEFPSSWRFINRESDFDVQDDTSITLENGLVYLIGESFSTLKYVNVQGNNVWTSLDSSAATVVTYTGAGFFFRGTDFDSFTIENCSLSCPNGDGFSFVDTVAGRSRFFLRNVGFRAEPGVNCVNKVGTFTNLLVVIFTELGAVQGVGVTDGITLTGDVSVFNLAGASILSIQASYVGLDFSAATLSVNFSVNNFANINFVPGSIGMKALPDSVNMVPGLLGKIRDCEFIGNLTPLSGFSPGNVRYNIKSSPPLKDSSIRANLKINGSSLVTVISAPDTPTRINAIWSDGTIEERILFADKATFASNILTSVDGHIDATGGTAFSHSLSNGDHIHLMEKGGLPVGLAEDTTYFAGNVTATTFQLFSDEGLTNLVTFTGVGTEPNYYNHSTGNSASGWFIYIGENDASISVNGWVTIEKNTGADSPVRTVVMKTDTSYTVIQDVDGSTVSAKNNIPSSSQVVEDLVLSEGEGILVYVENGGGSSVNNIITDAKIVISMS